MGHGTVLARPEGVVTCEFADGGCVKWTLPSLKLSGLLWGDRVIDWLGSWYFHDDHNGLECELKLYARKGSSLWGNSTSSSPSDCFHGKIIRKHRSARGSTCADESKSTENTVVCDSGASMKQDIGDSVPATAVNAPTEGHQRGSVWDEVVGMVEGCWLKELNIDGLEYWHIARQQPAPAMSIEEDVEPICPSDARYREDLIWLARGEEAKAGHWKLELEKKQRRDRESRIEGRKLERDQLRRSAGRSSSDGDTVGGLGDNNKHRTDSSGTDIDNSGPSSRGNTQREAANIHRADSSAKSGTTSRSCDTSTEAPSPQKAFQDS
eukprot:Filipodium_phascolosomae@DN6491_c0_g1_i1.p1